MRFLLLLLKYTYFNSYCIAEERRNSEFQKKPKSDAEPFIRKMHAVLFSKTIQMQLRAE